MKILILISAHLGDNICSEPAIRAIRAKYPNAHITLASRYGSIFKDYPYLDEIISYKSQLDTSSYDFVFGFDGYRNLPHIVDYLAVDAQVELKDRIPRFLISEEEKQAVRSKFPNIDFARAIIISDEASHVSREWGRKNWDALCSRLDETVHVGMSRSFLRKVKHELAGKTGLRELMTVVSLSKLCICVDSGVSHVAAAVGTPAIVLYGPVNSAARAHKGLTFPIDNMNKVTPDMVLEAKEKYGLDI
jgi:ADP-heptose:LPS heptosyltransferase